MDTRTHRALTRLEVSTVAYGPVRAVLRHPLLVGLVVIAVTWGALKGRWA